MALKYFNDIAIENVDIATKLTLNGKSYQLVYVPGSTDQPNGYGAVSVQVSNATQIATSVSLAVENDRAYYVIDGISLKYATQEELMADFKFRIANIPDGSSNGKTYLTEANVIVASFDATTGSFTLKIDITDLILNSKPYYTRIGNADGVSDFNYLDVSKVEMSDVTADGKTFSLVYVPGSKKGSEGYGTISIKVTNAG